MSTTYNDGGPAFPVPSVSWQQNGQTCTAFGTEGMTLRDYFAAHAPQMPSWFEMRRQTWYTREVVPASQLGPGYVKHENVEHLETDEELWFRWRLYYADAMLAERAKTKGDIA
jgi:hypothetical protein